MSRKNLGWSSSLFVGRWQPFHAGHKALVETVLKKKKPIVIAIRDTEINAKNPYSVAERWTMIQEALKEYGSLVKIIAIPDIDEICYGRDVGYEIREIELGSKAKSISGTKIRKLLRFNKIIWLTGQSGAGKTTIANALREKIGGIVLDGDAMRESVSLGLGFNRKDREEHNLRIARLAKVLSKNDTVIVSLITPFEELRSQVDAIAEPIWIYVERDIPATKTRPYEVPRKFNVKVNSDTESLQNQVKRIVNYLKEKGSRKG
jgi:cytidyltransferase-like protein